MLNRVPPRRSLPVGRHVPCHGSARFPALSRIVLVASWVLLAPPGAVSSSWLRTAGGEGRDLVRSVARTSDGGFIACGETTSFGSDDADLWLVKLDAAGDLEWHRRYGGPGLERGFGAHEHPDGGFVVLGDSTSWSSARTPWVLLLGSDLLPIWQNAYLAAPEDVASSALAPGSGRSTLVAANRALDGAWPGFVLLDLRGSGSVQRDSVHPDDVEPRRSVEAIALADSGFIVAGEESPDPLFPAYTKPWVALFGPSDRPTFSSTYGLGAPGRALALAQTSDGGFYVGGVLGLTLDGSAPRAQAFLLRIDGDGAHVWDRVLGRDGDDEIRSLAVVEGDAVLVAGSTAASPSSDADAWIARFNADGTTEWSISVERPGEDILQSIVPTAEGGALAVGSTDSLGAGSLDGLFIKVAADGTISEPCGLVGAPVLAGGQQGLGNNTGGQWRQRSGVEVVITGAAAVSTPILEPIGMECAETPPSEVSPPGAETPLRLQAPQLLSWEDGARSGSRTFNVYRGSIGELRSGSYGDCLLEDLATNSTLVPADPPAGAAWFYLVAGENPAGDGPLGHSSLRATRRPVAVCP